MMAVQDEKGEWIVAAIRKVIIDAGHGGQEPGAVYNGRMEKNDTLQLAFDVGNALERRGISVEYTRVNDVYDSPYEKAAMANASDGDLFLSLHRNSMPVPGTASGVESLVYEKTGPAGMFGRNIGEALEAIGWVNLGVKERPGLVVLKNTKIPAVLVEVGFINNERDNEFLDENMAATADAIADGVLRTFEELDGKNTPQTESPGLYVVQTGVYRLRRNAEAEVQQLRELGAPAYMVAQNGLFYVRAGAFRELDHAVRMEQSLRRLGYSTVILRT